MNCLYTTQGELKCEDKNVVEHFIRSGTREHLYPYPVAEKYINSIPNELTLREDNVEALKNAFGKLPKGCQVIGKDGEISLNCPVQKDPYKQ